MGKKLKSIGLVLFSIFCTVVFSTSVSALTMEKDMDASEITIEDGMTIDGAGKFTITGGFVIDGGKSVTIKNVTISGEGTKDILIDLRGAGDVVIENVTFENYTKAGIYSEAMTSLSITGSTFDASDTDKLGDGSYPGNPEEDLIKRSAAGIDLNLGNGAKTIDVKSITIKIKLRLSSFLYRRTVILKKGDIGFEEIPEMVLSFRCRRRRDRSCDRLFLQKCRQRDDRR